MHAQDPERDPLGLATLFQIGHDPWQLFAVRTEAVDRTIVSAYLKSFPEGLDDAIAVAAVGGFGRRELFPYSDVDLLIVAATESEMEASKAALAEFLRILWDGGLRIGHSTRTVADCCRFHPENTEFHIGLLDLRYVTGSREIFDRLQAKIPDSRARQVPALVAALVKQSAQRHAKFNNTPYHLEPNVKEAPGGIRDIHLLRWLLQLQPDAQHLQTERSTLEQGEPGSVEWLFAVRCFLHLQAGRDSNLLSFEMQDEAGRLLPPAPIPPEEWMRQYFTHARRVYRRSRRAMEFAASLGDSRLKQFFARKKRSWRRMIASADFPVVDDRVHLREPYEPFGSAQEVLQLFCFVGRQGTPLSWDAQWTLRQQRAVLAQLFAADAASWQQWCDLLSIPYAGLALTEMHETGVLAAAIPLWRSIESLVVRDFYHRYTVDEHTLAAIREVDRLGEIETTEPTRFERLAQEDGPSPELRLALLLHDIGKGTTPGDHMRGSRKAARTTMASWNVPEPFQQRVLFLIRHHLDLSLLMNGRDLEDPATARLLTAEINTLENLRRLTLLTFADISAVNSTAMSPWRVEQLWRVYSLGVQQLTLELASDRIHEPAPGFEESRSARLLEFLEGFPKRYVRTHTAEQIEHHLQLSQRARRDGVSVEIAAESGAYRMTMLAHDKSGLFAALCGALASFGMNIVQGEASSNTQGFVLDEIRFTDPNRTLELNPVETERLQFTVAGVVSGSLDVVELLKRRRPPRRPTSESTIIPSVRFVDGASDQSTLIDFVGEDRPGLLYDLATAIRETGCNIEVVMIDTKAHRAIDVFYVTHQGTKLGEGKREELLGKLLDAAGFGDLRSLT